eukprot:552210-Amorphochlora_amoeboformis.AAC.1
MGFGSLILPHDLKLDDAYSDTGKEDLRLTSRIYLIIQHIIALGPFTQPIVGCYAGSVRIRIGIFSMSQSEDH